MSLSVLSNLASDCLKNPYVRNLSSSDRKIRDTAFDSLKNHISVAKSFDNVELLQYWQGLYYYLWMSDRPLVQFQIIDQLANLLHLIDNSAQFEFLRAFWIIIAYEWVNIDSARINKYLSLIRRLVREALSLAFQSCQRNVGASVSPKSSLAAHLSLFEEIPLNTKDISSVPNGLRFHVIDVYIDELYAVDCNGILDEINLQCMLGPLRQISQESPCKAIRKRAKEALRDPRLLDWNNRPLNAQTISNS